MIDKSSSSRRMTRRVMLVSIIIAGLLVAPVQAVDDVAHGDASLHIPTISETIALAIENNADVTAARLQLEEAATGLQALTSGLLGWRLDANVSDELFDDQRTQMGFPGADSVNALSATLSLRKALAVGARAAATIEEQRIPLQQAERALHRNVADVIIETYDAYRQLELGLMRYHMALDAKALVTRAYDVAENRFQQETITEIDAEEARLQLLEATNDTRHAAHMLNVAWTRLAHLIGIDPIEITVEDVPVRSFAELQRVITDGGAPFTPSTLHPWEHETESDMIASALRNRSEIEDAHSLVELAGIAIEKTELDRRPKFELSASYTTADNVTAALSLDEEWVLTGRTTATHFSHDMLQPADEWKVNVGVTWNIFDSGANRLALQSGDKSRQRAIGRLRQAEEGIELDVLNAHATVLRAHDALLLSADRVGVAEAKLDIEKAKADLGTGTDLTIDEARLALTGAVIDAVSRRFEYESAVLQLARAKGLNPDEISQLADELSRW